MIERIARKLEDVRRQPFPAPSILHNLIQLDIPVLVCIPLAGRIAVALDVLVRVEGDDGVRAESSVDLVGHKPFTEDSDDRVIVDVGNGKRGEVGNSVEFVPRNLVGE